MQVCIFPDCLDFLGHPDTPEQTCCLAGCILSLQQVIREDEIVAGCLLVEIGFGGTLAQTQAVA